MHTLLASTGREPSSAGSRGLDRYVGVAAEGVSAWFSRHSPPDLEAIIGALSVTAAGGSGRTAHRRPQLLCDAVGWTVTIRRLGAATGGLQALLVPRLGGGFSVIVDPDLTPDERASGADPLQVRADRIAHEVAHALLYRPGEPPLRCLPPSAAEEVFCDELASRLSASEKESQARNCGGTGR